jgi:hypothetical protein
MTAAHLGLSVIKMNWKQKDRLAQALGFMPYNEHEWSRRESLDDFREALFKRQVVIRDGHAVRKGVHESTDFKRTEEDGVFLAKECVRRAKQAQQRDSGGGAPTTSRAKRAQKEIAAAARQRPSSLVRAEWTEEAGERPKNRRAKRAKIEIAAAARQRPSSLVRAERAGAAV